MCSLSLIEHRSCSECSSNCVVFELIMAVEIERLRAQVDRESERLAEKARELRLRGMKCFDTVGPSTHVKCDSEYCEACHVDVNAKLHMRFLRMTSSIPLELKWRSVLRPW